MEFARKVTRKGQVTLPAPIRRSLGISEGQRVTFVLENGTVRLIPTGSVVIRTAGKLKSRRGPQTAEALRRAAEDVIAADVADRTATE